MTVAFHHVLCGKIDKAVGCQCLVGTPDSLCGVLYQPSDRGELPMLVWNGNCQHGRTQGFWDGDLYGLEFSSHCCTPLIFTRRG